MKISIVKESLCIGGTERSAANISVALAKQHDVTMVLFDGSEMVYPYGGTLLDMKLPPCKSKTAKVLNTIKRAIRLHKHVKKEKPDIVFFFTWRSNPINKIKLKKSVKVLSIRDYSAFAEKPEIYKKSLDTSDAIICNSQYIRECFINKYPQDKEEIFSVNNIIDVELINSQKTEKVSEEFLNFKTRHSKLVVSVGRFCKEKAFENLLESFAQVCKKIPDAGLVLVGDGEYKEKYLMIIERFGIADNVFFTGFQKNPYKYMAECDLFVLSSLSEGFPNVLAEAMALSLPVVSVNCFSGPAEILMKHHDYGSTESSFIESDFGILTPHYDARGTAFAIHELAEAIIYLLSDAELMKKYGELSAKRAAEFSDTAAVKKFEKIFETLIDRRRAE